MFKKISLNEVKEKSRLNFTSDMAIVQFLFLGFLMHELERSSIVKV